MHPVSRQHLEALTGPLGILQHATGSRPDPNHGYCVDDVARALQVDLLHARELGWEAVAPSVRRGLGFLEEAFDEETGRFRNFRAIDGTWIAGKGSDDSLGRAMLALGETVAAADAVGAAPDTLAAAPDGVVAAQSGAVDTAVVTAALALFGRAFRAAGRMSSPRAQASVVLGCAALSESKAVTDSDDPAEVALGIASGAAMRRLATDLHARFIGYATPGWPWPEPALTYENALLPRALIVAGHRLGADVMQRIGFQVLDWLIDVQTAPEGHLSPIGNGWWPHRGQKSRFDQQPIEATSLLLAAEAAYRATGNPRYRAAMERAYAWFLGANDLGLRVARTGRGAGADGLTPTGINANEGAESTLMWLIAAEHVRAIRREPEPVRASVRRVETVRAPTVRSLMPAPAEATAQVPQ